MKLHGAPTLLCVAVLAGVGGAARAEPVRATATARAVILDASEIVGQRDLAFGDIVSGPAPGSILIDPATEARASTGGVSQAGGAAHSAAFVAPGTPDRVYIVQLPSQAATLSNGAGATMTVSDWTSDGPAVRRFDASGVAVVRVGGRLNVGAEQADGTYSGTFEVRIIYQ